MNRFRSVMDRLDYRSLKSRLRRRKGAAQQPQSDAAPTPKPQASGAQALRRTLPPYASFRTVSALILREMSATYGRSPGGYLWAFLEPTLGLALLVIIFSIGFRAPPLGSDFAIFYASGLLPFFLFTTTVAQVQQSINFSRQLLTYPRVTFLDAIVARFILNILTQLLVAVVLFTLVLTMSETRTVLRMDALLNAYAMAAAFGLGVGALNCLLISRQQIWQTVWGVISRPLVLVSGVVFLHDRTPEPYRTWLEWNPLVHIVGEARRGFYFSYSADYVNPTYVYGLALVTTVFGFLFLRRYTRDLLER